MGAYSLGIYNLSSLFGMVKYFSGLKSCQLLRHGPGRLADHFFGIAQGQVADRQTEAVLDGDAGGRLGAVLDEPVGARGLARRRQPGCGHDARRPQPVGAVQRLAVGVEDFDAQDQVVGRAFALQRAGQHAEVGELQAQRQRGLDAVLDRRAGDDQALFDDALGVAAVLEEVQEAGHAHGEQAHQHGDQDHLGTGCIQGALSTATRKEWQPTGPFRRAPARLEREPGDSLAGASVAAAESPQVIAGLTR